MDNKKKYYIVYYEVFTGDHGVFDRIDVFVTDKELHAKKYCLKFNNAISDSQKKQFIGNIQDCIYEEVRFK